MTPKKKLAPVHPGEILLEEFMKPLGLSQTRLGRDLGVSPRRINEIVHGKRSVTADTALRLSRYFGTSAEFWLGLQADYDLDMASDRLAERIAKGSEGFFAQAGGVNNLTDYIRHFQVAEAGASVKNCVPKQELGNEKGVIFLFQRSIHSKDHQDASACHVSW